MQNLLPFRAGEVYYLASSSRRASLQTLHYHAHALQARQCRAHQALTSSKIKERLQQRNTASFRFLFGSLSVSCTKTSRERLNGSCRCGMFNVMYEKTLLIWKRSDMGRSKVFNAVELQMCQAFGTVDRSTAFSPASMLPAVEFQH